MASTLSNGYILPANGDLGDVFWPALEANIQRVNDHNHDGTNSSRLAATSVETVTEAIPAATFTLVGSQYRATVDLPGSGLIENVHVTFRDPTTQAQVLLHYEKISTTQFYVFTNFVQDYEVHYS